MFVLRNTIEPPTARRKTLRYYKSRLTCLLLLGWISQVSANQIPTATALLITTKEDSKTSVILKGTDPEKKKLTYAIVSQPQYGTVTLAGGKATYLPAANYFNTTSSPDGFMFKVNDGTQNSTPATISVVVTAVNDPPVAQNSIASVIQNTATDITLSASDVDGDILTYLPTKKTKKGGTVIWKTGNIVTYTPKLGYVGSDSFTFTVQDNKKGKSKTATVSITVTAKPQNLPPIANAGADQNINEQTLVTLDGSASKDTDGSIDSYAWKQTAGTTVTLASTTSAKPTFTAPDVVKDEILTFELTVKDDKSAVAKDSVNILVKNINNIIVQPTPTGKLNDTGITTCFRQLTCPQSDYPMQDAEYGRDANQVTNNDYDGHAGFSFTKISSNGYSLPINSNEWACIKDNVTGLIWEVKTNDGGLHDLLWTYSWYEPNDNINGGYSGKRNGGDCNNLIQCDTYGYVQAVNTEGLCGAHNWRMPTREELKSISYDHQYIQDDFFNNAYAGSWSSSTDASKSNYVYGVQYIINKEYSLHVQLVRDQ
ncbi:Lcl C-terminal domain-containing protein [Thiothrix fructosivorans]|uniref:Tandem-95 repeat protein n=1 Tax=Thiothrix fructosivorans TaxID=111770 RepID=A0A8B0SJW8_9GAMM|nr:DUF1566 domain-containing protein [Thiothrix fructosivorans]MBO0613421.1 tandem-95 repeat protein [Thiothrix fructosivorans]QTX11149.1 tandem-95 repeat protein [Thiothrix fructosivorans]